MRSLKTTRRIYRRQESQFSPTRYHDYSEAETRDYFIDLLLKEAGWELTEKNFEIESYRHVGFGSAQPTRN